MKKIIITSFIIALFSLALLGSGESNTNNKQNEYTSDSTSFECNDAYESDTLCESEPVKKEPPSWLVGTWIRTLSDGHNVGQLILRINEDGSGVFETVDRGTDGLLYKKLDSFHFNSAQIYDDELWLCITGRKMKDTPIMKVRNETVYGYDGSEYKKVVQQVDTLEDDEYIYDEEDYS